MTEKFLEGCSWFKFNKLGMALGMALKFNIRVAKKLRLRIKRFRGLIPTFIIQKVSRANSYVYGSYKGKPGGIAEALVDFGGLNLMWFKKFDFLTSIGTHLIKNWTLKGKECQTGRATTEKWHHTEISN